MNFAYRASQFFQLITARLGSDDFRLIQAHLPSPLVDLFKIMSQGDQAHSLQILRTLISNGEVHPDLLAAGLLHDVGKSRYTLQSWERVLIVLANAVAPNLARRLGRGDPQGWRRSLVIASHHPKWGAQMVREAGGSETLIELIRRHHEPAPEPPVTDSDRLLIRLQITDGWN